MSVREGNDRSDTPYVRPATLLPPTRPPKLVYLDLNHWISLAKAHAGVPGGADFRNALDACIAARATGAAKFPLADSIYIEISKIPRPRQRRHLRQVIELVSAYDALLARPMIAAHEIEAMLDAAVGPSPQPIEPTVYVGWGVIFAFGGGSGRLRVRNAAGEDVTAEVRARHPGGVDAFDARLADGELQLQRVVLEGPTAEREAPLRQSGWEPRAAMKIATNRADQEVEQAARFTADPRWRAGRIRDVVAAREAIVEVEQHLSRGLSSRGVRYTDVFDSVHSVRRHFDAMPSFDVAVSLKVEYHRDAQHRWTPNDIHDIDALGSALPCCDVVVTDKAAASHVNRCGLSGRLGTVVLSSLNDLLPHLSGA